MSASSPESVAPVSGCPSNTTIFFGLWSLKNPIPLETSSDKHFYNLLYFVFQYAEFLTGPISLVYLNDEALLGLNHRRAVVLADVLRPLRHDTQSRHQQVVNDLLHEARLANRRGRNRNNNRRRWGALLRPGYGGQGGGW